MAEASSALPETHDSRRQSESLLQCLSHSRTPLAIFLGAGCPVSIRIQEHTGTRPLIPDIAGLTTAVYSDIREDEGTKVALDVLVSHFSSVEGPTPNIETMLSNIRSLASVVGTNAVFGLSKNALESIESKICERIAHYARAELPVSSTPYRQLAEWIGAIPREHPLEIFTTNYDLLVEQAMERSRVPYSDGFVGSCQPFFDLQTVEEEHLPPRWARLWKLHGSINWQKTLISEVTRTSGSVPNGQALIHPSHMKYSESRRMPYLALMDRLRAFLKKPASRLVICGYSFGDQHINEVIVQGLQANSTAVVFGLLYGELSKYDQAIHLAKSTPNLVLLAGDAAVVGRRTGRWAAKERDPMSSDTSSDEPSFPYGDFARFGEFLSRLTPKDASGETRAA